MTSITKNIIEVTDLTKTYGTLKAVDGVSFAVRTNETFGILGPNGAGKTTTVEIMEGLRVPDGGKAIVCEVDVVQNPQQVKSKIGVQLQASAFTDNLRLGELIDLFASFYRRKVNSKEILQQVGLTDKASSYYPKLSGGQKQRFSIATALVNNPQVLFLDEPTTGLDPQARRNLWELVKGMKKQGMTIVLTTHYMDEAEELCDRVAVFDHGKVIALDSPDALIKSLLGKGFHKERVERLANLEDVFLDLTGHALREE